MEIRSLRRAIFYWLVALSITGLFIYLNHVVSNMTPFGIAVNFLGLIVLGLVLLMPAPELIVMFFVLNFVIGPFLFINLQDIQITSIGRMDFSLALITCAALIFARQRLSMPTLLFFGALFTLLFWGFVIHLDSEDNFLTFFDNWSNIIGRISVGALLFIMVKRHSNPAISKWAGFAIILVLLVHLFASWLQLVIPVSFRSVPFEPGWSFSGFTLNRPVGLYAGAYVYGVTTVGVWWLWNRIAGHSYPRLSNLLLFAILPVAAISTRTVIPGLLLFVLLYYWRRITLLLRGFIILSISAFLLLSLTDANIFSLLDQSNSTKVILVWTTLATWFGDFPAWRSFLGYGSDQAGLLMTAGSIFFDLANTVGANYDNRVDDGLGFPIHNVFVQFFFEYGLVASVLALWLILRGFNNIVAGKIDRDSTLFWCVAVTHYSGHNGIFSPLLTVALLYCAYPVSHDMHSYADLRLHIRKKFNNSRFRQSASLDSK